MADTPIPPADAALSIVWDAWTAVSGPEAETRFAVGDRLGVGGMGEVMLALDPTLNRTVALKVLKKEVASDPGMLSRFVLEAQVTAQLDHPNIVPVYTMERTAAASPAFSMKLVRGQTFEEYLDVCREQVLAGKVDEEHTLHARLEHLLKACDAMAYSHARGVIHRDLKPENVMLGAFGEVYVMDWGIARLVGTEEVGIESLAAVYPGAQGPGATQVGSAIGTPSFMSPEQAMGRNAELTPASDQYALGLILFEIASLTRALTGPSAVHVAIRAQDAEKEPLVHIAGRRIPGELKAIIRKATAARPEGRYDTVEGLAADIRRFLRREETEALPDNLVRRLLRTAARHTGKVAVIVMSLVLAVVLAASVVAIGSLGAILVAQRTAAAREHRVTALLRRVDRRAHAMDMGLFEHAALVERLGAHAEELLAAPPPAGDDTYALVDLQGSYLPPDWAESARYEQAVSFLYPVNVGAPDAPLSSLTDDVRRLAPLRHDLRRVFVESYGEADADSWSAETIRETVEAGAVPIPWVYVGLESGLIVNYPGNPVYSPEFDTRKRPWYTMVAGTHGAQWGPPVPDDSGLGSLVPCSVALYDDEGVFLGVAGMANGLDYLVGLLTIAELPGQTAGYLVEPEGRIVVQTGDEAAKKVAAGLYGNAADEMPPFPEAEVAGAIREGEPAGFVETGGDLLLWNRLESLGWAYVVRVDATVFGSWSPP